jgi:hypothetical protein
MMDGVMCGLSLIHSIPYDLLEVSSVDHVHEGASGANWLLVHLAGTLLVVSTAAGAEGTLARARCNKRMTVKGIHRHDVVIGRLRLSIGKSGKLAENVKHPVKSHQIHIIAYALLQYKQKRKESTKMEGVARFISPAFLCNF